MDGTSASFSRGKLVREASLTQADMNEVAKCRRDHNRLGFAYQIGFARLFNRFPAQQPLEINDELLSFVAVQMNIDSERISDYASWQHTVSEHQARIQQYLGLRPFDMDESNALERFAFEESCRLEQTALLLARAQEFLKERRGVFSAESALLRLVGEQKKLAHESIVTRIADSFSPEMAETINGLLDIQPGETVSALQKIKANPAKSSAPAMNALMHKMAAIEATGIPGIDLSWLNANYQRAMFHYVRKCTADRLRELAGPRRLATLTCFLRQSYYSTCFSDLALEFYTFLADNYAPFHSMPIECTDRDAAFVLDGLLYNESDMEIEEHYTDTHGYTELNFAAFAMLGRRFCPRIKDVKHQRIYRSIPTATTVRLHLWSAAPTRPSTLTRSPSSGTAWVSSTPRSRQVTSRPQWP